MNGRTNPSRLAYVIVAFRSARDLPGCLDAIAADRVEGDEIIVVDNASPDDSAAVAHAHAARPKVVLSPDNRGFGAGCNLGAAASSSDLLLFVNPDARLAPGATAELLAAADADPTVAVFGAAIAGPGGERGAASAGFEPSLRTAAGHFLLLARIPVVGRLFPPLQLPATSAERNPDWVSGAALMVRARAFASIGGFDESLFMYMEDVDLCRRLRERGHAVAYVPEARVEHALGGSQGAEQAERWYRAFHAYVRQHRGPIEARVTSLAAALGLALRAAVLRRGNRAHSRRLARAARCALRLALGGAQA